MADIPQPNAPIEANQQCVAALERWLAKAKRGEMKHVTIQPCQKREHLHQRIDAKTAEGQYGNPSKQFLGIHLRRGAGRGVRRQ